MSLYRGLGDDVCRVIVFLCWVVPLISLLVGAFFGWLIWGKG